METKKIEFSFEGNHVNKAGNPLGYTRTTTNSKWSPEYQKYQNYKLFVVEQYWKTVEGRMRLHKPFIDGIPRGRVTVTIEFMGERHADPDNVGKAILDALFENDKEMDLTTNHTCGHEAAKVTITIDIADYVQDK
jgi:Holliday junction resolvase RusA-like endonuclease